MFSGIIRSIGTVIESGEHLSVHSPSFFSAPHAVGDSIAVAGVCLTIVELLEDGAAFQVVSETLRRTTLGSLSVGDRVNLERSMALGDLVHGHLVQGHVDAVAELVDVSREERGWKMTFELPSAIAPLIAEKGSVTIDGVSLTVGNRTDRDFSVFIIPHTWKETTLGELQPGMQVNIESDCIAKYVAQLLTPYQGGSRAR